MSATVSIVIPAYNASEYITDAVCSALNQTCNSVEIVVIDDGSTDDTAAKLAAFSDSRLRHIYQKNSGQSAAINHGVEVSAGQYIKVLDADDWINPEHIQCQLDAIAGRQDVISSCQWGYFTGNFRKPVVHQEHTNRDYDDPLQWIVDSLTKDQGMMGGWMWLIPRSIWASTGGYDPRLSLNNDFHFSIATLLAANAVKFAEGAVYSYRKGVSGALSGSYGQSAMESAFLTTDLGTKALLQREESERIRKICADRFKSWLFAFYPDFVDLVTATEKRIAELGGSDLEMQGGRLLRLIKPAIGWKGVRRLQSFVYRYGWKKILARKSQRRLAELE